MWNDRQYPEKERRSTTGFADLFEHAKIATPEKALFDTLYLAPARSRLFARLPELDLPRSFRWPEVRKFVAQVKSRSRRTFLADRIEALRKG